MKIVTKSHLLSTALSTQLQFERVTLTIRHGGRGLLNISALQNKQTYSMLNYTQKRPKHHAHMEQYVKLDSLPENVYLWLIWKVNEQNGHQIMYMVNIPNKYTNLALKQKPGWGEVVYSQKQGDLLKDNNKFICCSPTQQISLLLSFKFYNRRGCSLQKGGFMFVIQDIVILTRSYLKMHC